MLFRVSLAASISVYLDSIERIVAFYHKEPRMKSAMFTITFYADYADIVADEKYVAQRKK